MTKINSFLPSLSSINRNFKFDSSFLDKRISIVAVAIFGAVAILTAAYLVWRYLSYRKTVATYKEVRQDIIQTAIDQLKTDPTKSPPIKNIEDLIAFAKMHGKEIKNLNLMNVKQQKTQLDLMGLFLPRIDIPETSEITTEQLKTVLGYCPNLESLTIFSMDNFDNSCLPYIAGLSKLKELSLSCPKLTDLKPLSTLINLKKLLLNCGILKDDTLQPLKDLSALQSLGLWGLEKMTDKSLQHIANLTNLVSFYFGINNSSVRIKDAQLSYFADLTKIKSLNLSRAKITDAGLVHLAKLTSLESLDINDCPMITDAGLAHLKKLTGLKCLRCNGNDQITYNGLVHLAAMPALQGISLQYCKNIKEEEVKKAGITCKFHCDL